jgi:hypothetical protein
MSAELDGLSEELVGGSVQLRYVARAGLLPELSRQTYDSLWKAVREAVLNAVDAQASRIDLDLSRVTSHGEMSVADDGIGMSTKEFCEQFMSVGGSSKFGESSRFGRIGIGSLALLQYGEAATVETKCAGSTVLTRARISHPWDLSRHERRATLESLSAGSAVEVVYDGDPADHFTRVRISGVNDEVVAAGSDPNRFYGLIERLRHVLPLPWAQGPLVEALETRAPDLVKVLRAHTDEWSAPVVVHSAWERDIALTRRAFGDDRSGAEAWSGPPVPILKTLRVPGETPRRRITVAGYLLNQRRASPTWMGLTARVQNVTVEEHSFFDVTADPGFRKYISGEVWLLGEVDRERLINIDRASFNRECLDYQAAQRYLARTIVDFKSSGVQRPQRAKVAVRRTIEQHIQMVEAVGRVVRAASAMYEEAGLPASERNRRAPTGSGDLVTMLEAAGAVVDVAEEMEKARLGYELDLTDDGSCVRVRIRPSLVHPTVEAGGASYALQLRRAGVDAPPVVIRNRPRRITVNLDHRSHSGRDAPAKVEMGLALELAYLLSSSADDDRVYDRMLALLEAL